MKFFTLGFSIFLVILGAWASRKYQLTKTPEGSQEVLSQNSQEEDLETPTPAVSVTPTPTQTPRLTPSPTPKSSVSDYYYPNASVKSQTETLLLMESSDDTDKITDWYKGKIESLGANVKSFVVTKANDKVLNKLAGAGSGFEINVEISKDSGTSHVSITVSLK